MGSTEIGSNVRDAGAYILWAIVKYYKKDLYAEKMLAFIDNIIFAAFTDRERLVRYAYASVLQEFIGRTNLIEIELIQLFGFESLGYLQNSLSKL